MSKKTKRETRYLPVWAVSNAGLTEEYHADLKQDAIEQFELEHSRKAQRVVQLTNEQGQEINKPS